VVTSRPPRRRAGTPRRSTPGSDVSKRGSRTSTGSPPTSCSVRAGSISSRSRFQWPSPEGDQRWPSDPLGTAGAPVTASNTTVFHSAASTSSPRSYAVRKRSGVYAPSCSRSATRNGMSVYVLAYRVKNGTWRST